MIKRRFYRVDHGERDGAASDDSSSSSSDGSDVEAQLSDDNDVDDEVDEPQQIQHPSISSSGYESEESSGDELDADTSGLITKDDDSESGSDKDLLTNALPPRKDSSVTVKITSEVLPVADDIPNCVLKSKSVFKCRLCPKIVCLNEESLTTHLKSKRHARSEKLLSDGRLKRFLNSDGEEEVVTDDEDGETHAERHARILALAQSQDVPSKKSRGRQRQRQRLKKKKQNPSEIPSSGQQKENRAKRRKKNVG